jgi:hypothetical protein
MDLKNIKNHCTAAQNKVFCVLKSRCLVMVLNNVDSSACLLKSLHADDCHSFCETGCSPPISYSRSQAPWGSSPEASILHPSPCGYVNILSDERAGSSLTDNLHLCKVYVSNINMLLKYLYCALYTSCFISWRWLWRVPSSGMWHRVALVRTDVSQECIASIIWVKRIGVFLRSVLRFLVTANVVPSSPIIVTLMMEVICSSETSVFRKATRRHIPEGGVLRGRKLDRRQD